MQSLNILLLALTWHHICAYVLSLKGKTVKTALTKDCTCLDLKKNPIFSLHMLLALML